MTATIHQQHPNHSRTPALTKAVASIVVVLGMFLLSPKASGVTNIFYPVADTSLLEIATNNNLGGFVGMNSGTTQEFKKTRALMRFDLSSLPTNTAILAAMLQLEVTRQPDELPNTSSFGLHRMLRPWGEGNKSPVTQPGKGLPASPGEATWNCAFHPTNSWTVPGGAFGVDFSGIESSSQFIYGVSESPYRFETSPEMVADVTAWVSNPQANFGWMLLCNDETSNFTARRFGAREDMNYPPFLELQYVIPPRITSIQTAAGQVHLHFMAMAGQTYVVEFRDLLNSGSWSPLVKEGPFASNTPVEIVNALNSPQRYYRLNTY